MKKDPPCPPPHQAQLLFLLPPNERGGGRHHGRQHAGICASVNVWKVGGEMERGRNLHLQFFPV